MTAIIGPSGRGKSTLLNLLGGLDPVYEGVIRFRGVELPKEEGTALRTYRGEKIGFVFQELNLITHLTATENVALPLLCRGAKRAEAMEKARKNLRCVGLEERADQRPALSGGERQRVAITRAFTTDAEFILADSRPAHSTRATRAGHEPVLHARAAEKPARHPRHSR
jgi:lipoprotein-releasing system ATP-binding protein